MIKLKAKTREKKESPNTLRMKGEIPAVFYGYNTENTLIKVESKEFEKIEKEAGESNLITLELEDEKGEKVKGKKPVVLIHGIQKDPLKGNFIHIDFYQPNLKEEVEAEIPINFSGEAPIIKSEGGTLVRNITRVTIKALPESLIDSIEVDCSVLESYDDVIKIADLNVPEGVEFIDDKERVVLMVSRPEDVERELEKEIEEEKEAEVVGEEEKEEEGEEVEEKEEEGEGEEKEQG